MTPIEFGIGFVVALLLLGWLKYTFLVYLGMMLRDDSTSVVGLVGAGFRHLPMAMLLAPVMYLEWQRAKQNTIDFQGDR